MRIFDIRRYEMLVRVDAFGVAHADVFPADSAGGKLFADLHTVVGRIEAHAVAEAASKNAARQSVSTKRAIAKQLRRLMATLSRTAKTVTIGTPGFAEKFRLPRSRGDQRLVAASRAVVQHATPFGDAIVAHNLPTTVLADTATAIDGFEEAIQAHAVARESRAAASAGIRAGLKTAFAIAEQLDTVVKNAFASSVTTLAEWKSARRVLLLSIPLPNQKPDEPIPQPA